MNALENVLDKFTAPSVPKRGKEEEAIDSPSWKVASRVSEEPDANGIGRYPMLYIGEGCNRMFW